MNRLLNPVRAFSDNLADTSNVAKGAALVGQSIQVVSTMAVLRTIAGSSTRQLYLLGYTTANDGGGGLFTWFPNSSASDDTGIVINPTDNVGNGRWIRNYDGEIHVRWFGAQFDYNGTTGTDDTAAIQAALNAASATFAGGNDVGGGYGHRVIAPKGASLVSSFVTVPNGVTFKGMGPYSTVINLASNFPTSTHAFILGDTSPSAANFSTAIEDMQLFSGLNNSAANKAMVYTTGAQHTSGLRRVKIFGGSRHCVRIEVGTGGAAYIMFDEVETFNKYNFASNAQWYIDYAGPLIVMLRGISTAGPSDDSAGAGSVCMLLKGGLIEMTGFHCEHLRRAIVLNKSGANSLYAELNGCTGNSSMDDLIRIESIDAGTVQLRSLNANGATNVINNLVDGTTETGRIILGPYNC